MSQAGAVIRRLKFLQIKLCNDTTICNKYHQNYLKKTERYGKIEKEYKQSR